MTTCLILAAGDAERHNGGNKPLLEVNGETLLERTCDMARQFADSIFLITHRTDLRHPAATNFIPFRRRWIVDTLLCSAKCWNYLGGTVVLLGDVCYTEAAINTVFGVHELVAFGKGSNIHALAWGKDRFGDVIVGLRKSVEQAEAHPRTHGTGKLWLFVECNGIPVIDFGDETTDFDSPQEHKRFIAKYANPSRPTRQA